MLPKYSIIIPCFNRADEVAELLESISQLKFDPAQFEIIISDDGSTDNTKKLVEQNKSKLQCDLIYLTQNNSGPGAARNHAMENANGDFFIFIDSDVTLSADWLFHIDLTLVEKKADAFGGPDSYREDFSPFLKAVNYSMTSFITTGGLRGKKGKKLARFYPRSFNMGLSRELWKKIGGFGSLRHGQDIEFSHRIIESGAQVIFIDQAVVYHKRRTNLRRFYKQVFNWGVARINLYKINKKMLEPLHSIPAVLTFVAVTLLVLSLIFDLIKTIVLWGFSAGILILIYSMIDSIRIYKSIKPALWLPLVMPAQVLGYGFGFIYNAVRRIVLDKDEKVGFKKSYYK